MCGRFVQLPLFDRMQAPWPELADELSAMSSKYNLAPTQRAAVVMGDGAKLELRKLRWGLVPHWVKDLKSTYSTINARIETVATKPAFRSAWKAPRRCLIPMAGYYEWRQVGKDKYPYYIQRVDRQQLYAAGLWEPRHALQEPDEGGSCTIITHDAVDVAGQVHDRMPVFLDPAMGREWMSAAPDDAMAMLLAAEIPALEVHPVSRGINNSRNPGGPEALDPVEPPPEQ
ncbi:MAG: SOS response-associated peptidase [Burkholderiales bacterium]|nr:SOS response-associated peptidase [Burkholderiales bacterium]